MGKYWGYHYGDKVELWLQVRDGGESERGRAESMDLFYVEPVHISKVKARPASP